MKRKSENWIENHENNTKNIIIKTIKKKKICDFQQSDFEVNVNNPYTRHTFTERIRNFAKAVNYKEEEEEWRF